MLEKELERFEALRHNLLKTNAGQFAVIKGDEFAGAFTTFEEAFNAGVKKFGLEPFLVKQIVEKDFVHQIPALMLGLINASI